MTLKVPIGIDHFGKVIEAGYTYIDKTLFVEEVIEQPAEVQLITRPRRFGKTLNMSMLAHFFDHRADAAKLFRGLAIEKSACFEQQGHFPVIFLSFKDLKADNPRLFLGLFREMVKNLYRAHTYLQDHLDPYDREDFDEIARGTDDESRLIGSIHLLMTYLHRHHGKRVVLLIDEYDSPIHEGYNAGYYEQVISFMRATLGRLLKSNASLEKAVLTGILRVAKESIFSDLNHIDVHTLLDSPFDDKFGFTQAETE